MQMQNWADHALRITHDSAVAGHSEKVDLQHGIIYRERVAASVYSSMSVNITGSLKSGKLVEIL